MSKKIKYYRVKESGCSPEFMSGNEFSCLQQAGANIKKLRNATEEEYKNYKGIK